MKNGLGIQPSPVESVIEFGVASSSLSTIAAKFGARWVARRPASQSDACRIWSV